MRSIGADERHGAVAVVTVRVGIDVGVVEAERLAKLRQQDEAAGNFSLRFLAAEALLRAHDRLIAGKGIRMRTVSHPAHRAAEPACFDDAERRDAGLADICAAEVRDERAAAQLCAGEGIIGDGLADGLHERHQRIGEMTVFERVRHRLVGEGERFGLPLHAAPAGENENICLHNINLRLNRSLPLLYHIRRELSIAGGAKTREKSASKKSQKKYNFF